MSKIDIDKLVADLVEIHAKRTGIDRTVVNTYLDDALAMQGLAVINNEVVVVNDRAYLNSKIERATPKWEGVDVDEYLKEIRGHTTLDDILGMLKEIRDLLNQRINIVPYIQTIETSPRPIEPWYMSPLNDVQANTGKEE